MTYFNIKANVNIPFNKAWNSELNPCILVNYCTTTKTRPYILKGALESQREPVFSA